MHLDGDAAEAAMNVQRIAMQNCGADRNFKAKKKVKEPVHVKFTARTK